MGEEFLREIRVAPKEMDFSMGYWVYGRKAAFISSRAESFGYVIESEELVQTLKSQFELIWRLSAPLKVDKASTRAFLKELENY